LVLSAPIIASVPIAMTPCKVMLFSLQSAFLKGPTLTGS